MRPLIVTGLLSVMLLVTACSSNDVPDDQALQPADTPDSWTERDLAGVTFATPPGWDAFDAPAPESGTERVAYGDSPDASARTGGMIVMVLPDPAFTVRSQAQNFLDNARNQRQAEAASQQQIAWPGAETAWVVEYTEPVQRDDEETDFLSRHLVLELTDGTQIQVTVTAASGTEAADLIQTALATTDVTGDVTLDSSS